jgi:ATP-dependent Clp protease protease subunit
MKDKTPKPYVINKGGSNKAEVLIYEQIGESLWSEGVTAKTFAKDLQAKGKLRQIDVRINSPGGSVFDGLAIYNTLKQHSATVNVYIDGMALSIASVIAMAGDNIQIAQNALMMIHNPQGMVAGTSGDMRKYADMLDKVRDAIVTSYKDRTSLDEAELIEMLDNETWMTAEEAVAHGFADDVMESLAIAAGFEMPSFITVPTDVAALIVNDNQVIGVEDMADKPIVDAVETVRPIAATVEELKALPGADAQWIVDQLSAHITLDAAKDALNARLVEKLTAATEHIAELQSRLQSRSEPEATANPTPPAGPVEIGSEPLPSDSAGGDPAEKESPWMSSPAAYHRKLMQQFRAEGLDASKAYEKIAREFPELMELLSE